MRPIEGYPIKKTENGFEFHCAKCGTAHVRATKSSAIRTLNRGHCKTCAQHYKKVADAKNIEKLSLYQNAEGKWCSTCSKCGVEQPYTRKDHAKQSAIADWLCKSCANFQNKTRPASHRGFRLVEFDKIIRAAKSRDLEFSIGLDELIDLFEAQTGLCSLTGMPLTKDPKDWSIEIS